MNVQQLSCFLEWHFTFEYVVEKSADGEQHDFYLFIRIQSISTVNKVSEYSQKTSWICNCHGIYVWCQMTKAQQNPLTSGSNQIMLILFSGIIISVDSYFFDLLSCVHVLCCIYWSFNQSPEFINQNSLVYPSAFIPADVENCKKYDLITTFETFVSNIASGFTC